jgi:hypothetical protein
MPAFIGPDGKEVRDPQTPTTSRLDRAALQKLAASAGGQYFELERDGDRRIANALIDTGKRIAPTIGIREDAEELYWYFLLLAAALLMFGTLFVRIGRSSGFNCRRCDGPMGVKRLQQVVRPHLPGTSARRKWPRVFPHAPYDLDM